MQELIDRLSAGETGKVIEADIYEALHPSKDAPGVNYSGDRAWLWNWMAKADPDWCWSTTTLQGAVTLAVQLVGEHNALSCLIMAADAEQQRTPKIIDRLPGRIVRNALVQLRADQAEAA